jgi:hypothetical protein
LLHELTRPFAQAGNRAGAIEPKNADVTPPIAFLDRPQGLPPHR